MVAEPASSIPLDPVSSVMISPRLNRCSVKEAAYPPLSPASALARAWYSSACALSSFSASS